VLGYILAGFLISPHFVWLPTIIGVENINTWANIGIVFLMFALGLEFSFKKIADVGVSAIVTSITVMGAMITIGYVVGNLLGWGRMDSMFLGGMLSMSSTMIILKAFEEYNLKEEKFGKLVLGTLVIEDIGGIFMMIILSTISVSQNVEGMKLVADIGMLLLMLVIWLVLGIFLIPTFLKKVSSLMNQETLLIVALAICFGMVIISNLIGFSEALGAFMAGSILAGTVKGERIEHLIQPLKDFFGAIFFVSVGMLVVPEMLVNYAMPIVILTIVTILGQMIFSTLGMLLSGQSLHTAIRGGSSMVQIGEFSFIVATLGLNLGVTSEFLYPIIVCVAVITTFYTPLSIKSSEGLYQFISARLPNRWLAFLRQYTSEKRSNSDRGGEWKKFITRYFLRTVITSAALFLIYSAGNYCKDIVGPWAAAIGTCILMIPVINLMQNNRSNAFK
ncbi:MAG: cation:proton antiporter, partial [Anaerovoracaceae bacterium]